MAGIPLKRFTTKTKSNGASWIANAAKSLGMVGVDVLKELNPTISEISTSAVKTTQEVYKQVRTGNISNKRVSDTIKQNRYVKLGQTAISNALEDLKAGNFNNTERLENMLMGGDGGSDSGMSFDDFGDWGDDPESSSSVNVIETGLSDKHVAQLSEISTRNTEAIIKSTEASINASIGMTTASMMQIQEIGNKLTSKLDTVNSHLSALVEFNNTNMLKFIEASTAYYDRMGAKIAADETSQKEKKLTAKDVFLQGSNGGINFKNYMELAKQQMKSYFSDSQAGSMLGMVGDMGDMLVANPLNLVSKMIIEHTIPEVMKNTMQEVDEAMSGAMVTMLQRLGDNWGNTTEGGIGGMAKKFIGKTFGLNIKDTKKMNLAGKVTGDPATFDGYTHHSITEIIPKYLRESTAYLKSIAENIADMTGGSKDIARNAEMFDYRTGTYRTIDEIQKEVYSEIRDTTASAIRESAFGKAMARAGSSGGVDAGDYNEALNDFLYRLAMNGTPDFSNPDWMSTIDSLLGQTKGSDTTKRFLRSAVQSSVRDRNSGASMSPGLLAGQAARNRVIRDMEADPTAYNLYATNPNGANIDDTMATVLYSSETGENTEERIKKHGSISDVLDNMNYLLERGINVHVTGKEPYPDDIGQRPNRRGVPKTPTASVQAGGVRPGGVLNAARNAVHAVGNAIGNITGRNNNQEGQTEEATADNGLDENADLTEEQIRDIVRESMQTNVEAPEGSVGSLVGKFQKMGKGIVGGIYDILQGNFRGGLSQITTSAGEVIDPSGKLVDTAKNKLLGQAVLDENGEVKRDENGNIVRESNGALSGVNQKVQSGINKVRGKISDISKMNVSDLKESALTYLFGEKLDPTKINNVMMKSTYGRRAEYGMRVGSKNPVIKNTIETFRDGMYGFYESIFGDKIDPNDPPSKIKKQMKEGVANKFKNIKESISAQMPEGLKQTLNTAKAGAGRGLGAGAIGLMLGGPLGAAVGAGAGIFTKSKMFQDFLYGEEVNGERTGGFKKRLADQWDEFKEKHHIGQINPKTGKRDLTKTKKMMATGAGIGLMASMFTPFGPIGGALAGIATGLVMGEGKVHDFIFGKKTVGENGEEKYEKGILARLGTIVETSWLRPIKKSASRLVQDAGDFVKDNILETINIGLSPVMKAVGIIMDDITTAFKAKLTTIGEGISNLMKNITKTATRLIINPVADLLKGKIMNSRIGRGVRKVARNAYRKVANFVNIPARAQRFVENRSLERRKNELQALADSGDQSAAKELEILNNPEAEGHEEAVQRAKGLYYKTDYKELRENQMRKRGARNEEKRAARLEEDTKDRNEEFIAKMTGGRLSEDTEENRKIAMENFQKGLNSTIRGKKYLGYKKDFKFEDYDSTKGESIKVDTAVAETASNTAEIAATVLDIRAAIVKNEEDKAKLISEIQSKREQRKADGVEGWDEIDDDDYNKLMEYERIGGRLTKKEKKAMKQWKKMKGRESRHEFVRNVSGKLEAVDKAINTQAGKVGKFIFKQLSGESYEDYLARVNSLEHQMEKELAKAKTEDERNLILGKYGAKLARRDENTEGSEEEPQIGSMSEMFRNTISNIEARRNSEDATPEIIDTPEGSVDVSGQGGYGRITGYANGTKNASPGVHIVGEQGPELVRLPGGASVNANDKPINVNITSIDKKGWKKFVKDSNKQDDMLNVSIGSSENILPVYTMGTFNSKTDKDDQILKAVDANGNITSSMVKGDQNDGKSDGEISAIAKTPEDEEKLDLPEKIKDIVDVLKNFKGGLISAAATLAPFAAGGALALGLGRLVKNVTDVVGITDGGSNVNENTAAIDEDGNVMVDEDGNVMQADKEKEDAKLGFGGRLMNSIIHKRTKVDLETGKAETVNDFTNTTLTDLDAKTRGAYAVTKFGAKALPKAMKFAMDHSPFWKGAAKVAKGTVKAAKWAGKGVGKIASKIANSGAGQAIAEHGSSIIETFKKFITETIPKIVKAIGKKLSSTEWGSKVMEKLGPFFDDLFKVGDDVLLANTTKITEFMSSVGGLKGIFRAINIGAVVLGGINGATSMGYMFDVDPKDPELPTSLKIVMTLISTALGALQGTIYGTVIDFFGMILSIEPFKILGQFILNVAIDVMTKLTGSTWGESLKNAQDNFDKMYEEYIRAEYDAAAKNAEATGKSIGTFEQWVAGGYASTSKEEFNNDFNANITARVGDWAIDAAGKATDWAKENVTVTGPTIDNSVKSTSSSASTAAKVDSTDAGSAGSGGLGGFGGDVPYYSQNDPRWKNAGYGMSDNATMGQAGCGPTAMAMAASGASGKNINPMQMANFAQKHGFRDETGTNSKFVQAASNSMGLQSTSTKSPDENFLHKELSKGKPVVLLGRDGGYGNSAFTKAGHYVVATGETPDGGIMINDPRGRQFSGKYDKKDVLGESARAWAIGGHGDGMSIGDLKRNDYEKVGTKPSPSGTGVTPQDVVAVARNEIGYHEKASNKDLDVKEANPGTGNWTKYGALTGTNGHPWCAAFIMWCIYTAANNNKDTLTKIICGPMTAACATLWDQMSRANRITNDPQPGDIIFYTTSHVGIVADVSGDQITTIEGNTSMPGSGGSEREGLWVAEKTKSKSNGKIKGFARPVYDTNSSFQGVSGEPYATVAGVTSNGSGTGIMSKVKDLLSNGFAGLFSGAETGLKNFWLTGTFNPEESESEEGATDTAVDENGNPTLVGTANMSNVDAYQFDGAQPRAEAAFQYLLDQGYSPAAAAGVIGNLMHESGPDLNPSTVQKVGGYAAGIAQWENYKSKSSRWKSLSDFAEQRGKQWTDFGTQLEFLNAELNGEQKNYFKGGDGMTAAGAPPTTFEDWKQSTDVELATRQFEGAFERAGKVAMDQRLSYAKGIYDKFVGLSYKPKDVTGEDAKLTDIGDLRRAEAAARTPEGGSGGFGEGCMENYDQGYMDEDLVNGGFGPSNSSTVHSYSPSKPISKQATSATKTSTAGSSSSDALVKQMISYLQTIAENTGTSASKLDYLKNLSGGTTINQSPSIQVQKQNPIYTPPAKSTRQINAERIAVG